MASVPRPTGGGERYRRARILRWAVAGAVTFIGAAAALAPWLYSPAAAKSVLYAQLQDATGLYVAARGYPRLALTPRPHVTLDDVVFADHNGALVIEAEQLHCALRLLPLLSGRLDVDGVALVRPRARIDLDRKIDAPGAAMRAAAAKPGGQEAHKTDNFRLGALTVTDGALRVRRDGADYAADKIEGALDWRRIGEPAALTGVFDWRGERLQLIVWIARPGAFLRGDPSVATARLDGESLRLEAQGVTQTLPNAHYAGRVAGSFASVREALRLLNMDVPLPGPFGNAQFVAQATTLSGSEAALKDLHISVDGNAFDGELTVRDEDGRPNVSATLKSGFVALKPMFADAPALVAADGQWSREPLEPPDLSGADVDLQLTAAHARLGRLTIDDAAVSATLRDGALDLSLVESQAYRGRLKARVSLKAGVDGALAVHATAQTFGVDARALLWDAFGKQAIGGALTSSVTLDATGGTIAELTKSLGGRATFTLKDGEIAGVDFERALRRLEKRPLSSAQDIRSGSSTIDHANATLRMENGAGAFDDALAYGPGFALTLSGTTNLAERSLALKAAAREADAAGKPREKGLQIAFDLVGSWDDLTLAPDPQAFIRRSGAAAPLLPEAPAP